MPETDSAGYIIPNTSAAAMAVRLNPAAHRTIFTLGESLLGGACAEAIEAWKALEGGSLSVVAGDSVYRFSSLHAYLEAADEPADGRESEKAGAINAIYGCNKWQSRRDDAASIMPSYCVCKLTAALGSSTTDTHNFRVPINSRCQGLGWQWRGRDTSEWPLLRCEAVVSQA